MAAEEKKEEGKYIYCIINSDEEKSFGPIGIGGRDDEVHTICYRDIAAVISDSPIIKYPITKENVIAHQRVMEEAMKYYTVLPVRFSTIAGSSNENGKHIDRIKREVLEKRYKQFKDLIAEFTNKAEVGLKVLWTDMKIVFAEIVNANKEIRVLKEKITNRPSENTLINRVKLGELVKNALDAKKEKEGKGLLNILKKLAVDYRENQVFGDNMLLNAAFLVTNSRSQEFDEMVSKLSEKHTGRMKFKYVGPVPPCNFIELVIILEEQNIRRG